MSMKNEFYCQEHCIHYSACLWNGEYTPTPCRHFKDKADAVEVRHGEWIVDNRTFSVMDKFGYVREEHKKTHTCSECRVGIVGLANMKYCPNCGAKMDGERRER